MHECVNEYPTLKKVQLPLYFHFQNSWTGWTHFLVYSRQLRWILINYFQLASDISSYLVLIVETKVFLLWGGGVINAHLLPFLFPTFLITAALPWLATLFLTHLYILIKCPNHRPGDNLSFWPFSGTCDQTSRETIVEYLDNNNNYDTNIGMLLQPAESIASISENHPESPLPETT